ncbi:uncharacterized protein B0P05DRAFT_527347 [Gilbertella persicaria]|uniref:uncharacterized protein n=1 Tax=Gilbertella persicaria TaxID=101096 RepID=UPI0022207B5B|nr:uncharacterized protein B0P05DRAFT_527347 [Gilbertella persicaria]KAI8091399.1 hypothetical protein B0P05DRAFT_527347 [Gilbertella persicaria]
MTFIRALKSTKNWFILITAIIVCFFFISSWHTKHTLERQNLHQYQEQVIEEHQLPSYNSNRLTPTRRQLLISALAHIRLGYVANRTPPYSTPPLLVLYTCKQSTLCGPLEERLMSITNGYYFSMLQQGSAFAYDMTAPVRFEWFFESMPSYMVMTTDQADYYTQKTELHQLKHEGSMTSDELKQRNFLQDYERDGTTIVSTTEWQGHWMDFKLNPSMKALRDKYRLNHLPLASDWFWIVSQLLFSKPSSYLREQLLPYQELMGGKIELSETLSPFDPDHHRMTPAFAAKHWLRIGLRIKHDENSDIPCLANHVANLCHRRSQYAACHVFISAPTRPLFDKLRIEMKKYNVNIHAVAEGFEFRELNMESSSKPNLFEPNQLKKSYARTFMDWVILSRMDYLVGQEQDGFLKTAAWAAQVHTDISKHKTDSSHCQIIPMPDW